MADTTPRSRRSALRTLLRLSAGAMAATLGGGGVACGARLVTPPAAREVAAQPSTPSATASPTARPAATPTPSAEPRLNLLAHSLAVPSIGLRAEVRPADSVRNALGRPEIVVPDSGLVTPNAMLGRNAINNIWILGHSRWRGVPQPLFRLTELRMGDEVVVGGRERADDTDLPRIPFRVQRLVLTDIEAAPRELYGARPRLPRVVLQTSARQAGDTSWILDRRAVEAKAERRLDGDIDDPRKYLLLLVVAELAPELAYPQADGSA